MYFPFLIPKSGRKRSAHGRRRFIQRFLSEPAEKQPVGDPQTLFSPDASSLTSARKQRQETAYKMADAILQETVGVFASK